MVVMTQRKMVIEAGQRFGRLTVVDPERYIENARQRVRVAIVRCDCGNVRSVVIGSLVRGATQSCGCLSDENRRQPRPRKHNLEKGQRFARLAVISPDAGLVRGERTARVTCDCGTELQVFIGNLIRGTVKSCGCLNREAIQKRTVWDRSDPDWERRRYLWTRFHITLEQYSQMLEAQGGHCALCLATPDKHIKKLHVDHDHGCCPGDKSCGRCVRGVLCVNCNSTLGRVEAIGLPELAAYYGYRLEAV